VIRHPGQHPRRATVVSAGSFGTAVAMLFDRAVPQSLDVVGAAQDVVRAHVRDGHRSLESKAE